MNVMLLAVEDLVEPLNVTDHCVPAGRPDSVNVTVYVGTALNNATIVPAELIIAFVVADEELVKVMLEFVSHPTNS